MRRADLHMMAGRFGSFPYFTLRALEEWITFFKSRNKPFKKSVHDSRDIYEQYDDREQRDYESKSIICYDSGKVKWMSHKDIRAKYLGYLYAGFGFDVPYRVLEVGCGNCINLVELKKQMRSVEFHGLDISKNRIETGKRYFGEGLSGVEFHVQSITDRTPWPDNYFDIVYSMHAIEQISEQTTDAIREMIRIARKKVVMIEPVYELGNIAQKLYLHNADHVRGLLRSIRELGYEPSILQRLGIHSNPLCQSSLVVIEKRF